MNRKKIVFGRIKWLHLPHCSQRWWNLLTKWCNLWLAIHKHQNTHNMKHCDKIIPSTIKTLIALVQSYSFTQMEHIPLISLLTHWIIWTDIFNLIYNEKYQFVSNDACDLRLFQNRKTLPYIYLNLTGNPFSLTQKWKFLNILNLMYIKYLY